jgi:ClpP class serine protease
MTSKRLMRGWLSLMLMALVATAWGRNFSEFQDVQSLDGNPSPKPAESGINNYRFQDEQLNLNPNDGLVKVLRTDQKILVNDFQTVIIPIKNVDRREIRNVLREAVAVDDLDRCGLYFGTTGGQVYASTDDGDTWTAIARDFPAVLSVEVQTLP